ncbi:uncharacterized protein PAC_11320 [Phialocephala subalpina]|uniref:Uncharacterized protein n=1 Tax=Phialocephala subalpina TaxID=576137 RepID=A0A1L7X8S9_9HELO|nr:uncharacterized protein PAC_11320 [Phialocephala subalpina]
MSIFEDYDDEKLYSYPSPSYTPTHSKHSSYSSTSSTNTSTLSLALSSYPEKYDESDPPPYTHIFYNTIDDKPLPPLPESWRRRERKVRFVTEKPLPPLPAGRDGPARRRPERKGSREGEYAWWTKRWSMSDKDYERAAKEKEIGVRSGVVLGKFKEEF